MEKLNLPIIKGFVDRRQMGKEKDAMFPRIKSYKNKDGSTRHYLFLVDNKRIGGKVRQVVRANFGRVENLDKVIPDVIEKLSKFSKKLSKQSREY